MLKKLFSHTKPARVLAPTVAPMQTLKPSELPAIVGGPVIRNGGGSGAETTSDSTS